MKIILCLVGGSKVEADLESHYICITSAKVGITKSNRDVRSDVIDDFIVPVSLLDHFEVVKD